MAYAKLVEEQDSFPVIVLPRKQLWRLHLRLRSLRDVEEVYRVLDEAGLRRVHTELKEVSKSYDAYVVVDASEARENCRAVSFKLSSRSGVLEVDVAESEIRGVEFLKPLERRSSDAILMRSRSFALILNILKKLWGTAGRFISYSIGAEVGKEHCRWIRKLIGKDLEDRALFEAMLRVGANLGWWDEAGLESFDPSRGAIAVKIYGSIECKYAEEIGPNADFLRGFLGNLASELMEGEFEAEESACIAKGDPYCLIRAWRK